MSVPEPRHYGPEDVAYPSRFGPDEIFATYYDFFVGWEDGLGSDFGWRYDSLDDAIEGWEKFPNAFIEKVTVYRREIGTVVLSKGMRGAK